MANSPNYAEQFESELTQKYSRELLTDGLTTRKVSFIDAKTVKMPVVTTSGYKDHSRAGGFNRGSVSNEYIPLTLGFDRDIEFLVDSMDVDETNQALSAANVTNVFQTEHAIPETDCYRMSKLYADFVEYGGTADTTALTVSNILSKYDAAMEAMDEAEVPEDGRIMYVTPALYTIIKNADGITRSLNVSSASGIDRRVRSLDDVTIKRIPSGRMKTLYDFSDGCKPGAAAKQIHMVIVHPSAVLACDKHSYIRLWEPGSHTLGDGWLYQNRKYGDLFVVKNRVDGIKIFAEA